MAPRFYPVSAPDAVQPHGHYSQAVIHGDTIYVSGILGHNDMTHEAPTIEVQAQACLDNIESILLAAGSALNKVLKLNIYVSEVGQWPSVDTVIAERFGDHRPARIVVPCGEMRFGSLIEIDAIAALST